MRLHDQGASIVDKVGNYISFNLIIRFHELKYPGKEIFKATTWGPRNKILPIVVALRTGAVTWGQQESGMGEKLCLFRYNNFRYQD